MRKRKVDIAVLIPCHNEERTVSGVVRDFKEVLPSAKIYVFDNASTDRTAEEARGAGATVYRELRKGKGNVVNTMFRLVEADVYIMVDGDGTYPADRIRDLLRPVLDGEADMVVGSRLTENSESSFKPANLFGNRMFVRIVDFFFRSCFTDLLSGYRVFNRRIVKSLPLLSHGFEIESELTLKCLERGYRIVEVPVNLSSRPSGSSSKIRVIRDGLLIFNTIFALLRDYKPLTAFGSLGIVFVLMSLVPGATLLGQLLEAKTLDTSRTLLFGGLFSAGVLTIVVGIVLHSIARRFQEIDLLLQKISERTSYERDPGSAGSQQETETPDMAGETQFIGEGV